MIKRQKTILVFSILSMFCIHSAFAVNNIQKEKNQYAVKQLKEDFRQMREAVERLHPALYEFTDKETFHRLFDQQMAKIDRPMDGLEFLRLAVPIVARIGCGHTHLFAPRYFWENTPPKFFPLHVIFLKGKTYVKHDYANTDAVPIGSEIISINGRPLSEIKEALKSYISADGYNNASREYQLMRSFGLSYGLHYGFQDEFCVDYRPPGQNQLKKANLQPVSAPSMLNLRTKHFHTIESKSAPDLIFEILEEKNTALMTIKNFAYYNDRDRFYAFIDQAFDKIHEQKIKNLILDFRDNSGGDPFCTTHLLSYIEPYPIPYFAKLYREYARFAQPIPLAGKRFKGDIYILINGGGFSSTGHLCALLKHHKFGTFVGTETGGTYTCNDASTKITLKHTKFMLKTARVTFQAAVRGLPKDRGILPDYSVEPAIEDVLNGRDAVLEYTLSLIDDSTEKKTSVSFCLHWE